MNKSELVEVLAAELNTTKKHAEQAVDKLVDIVERTVAGGEKVVISGFGTFEPTTRAPRSGVNPQTGERIDIPAVPSLHFRVGAAFKNRVR